MEQAEEEKRKLDNAVKAKALADKEFPNEQWIQVEDGIYKSPNRNLEDDIAKLELRDAQILRNNGSIVYLVPHIQGSQVSQHDAIVNEQIFEFKNVGGTPGTLESAFLKSRKQAPNVFINLETSNMTRREAMDALIRARNSVARPTKSGGIRSGYAEYNTKYTGGIIILKLKDHENLIYLNVDDLKV